MVRKIAPITQGPQSGAAKLIRYARPVALAAGLFAAVRCSDSASTAPQITIAKRASLALAPRFATLPAGAPSIDLSKVRGVLTGAGGDSVVSEALFQGDSAILVFTVSFPGTTGTFKVDLTAYDKAGVVAFHGVDTVTVKPGDNPPVAPPPLAYAGPDSGVAKIQVLPNPVQLDVGTTAGLAVTGTNAAGQPISAPIRLSWTARDPSVATVDQTGIVTAGNGEGTTYVIAQAVSGAKDSALVKVHAPVASFTVSPNPASVAVGETVTLVPLLKDASGHTLAGRTIRWSSNDETKATVSATGQLLGKARGSTTVIAIAEGGKEVDIPVTVVSPVDHIEATPNPITFASLGEQQTLTVKVVPHGSADVSAIPVGITIEDPTVVSMDANHVLTALKNGSTTIDISADIATLSVPVTVKQVAKIITVSPKAFSANAQGVKQQFTATVLDALNHPVSGIVTWTSSNPGTATVDATGLATTVQDGSALITASFGGLSDNATITVKRVATRIAITVPKTTLGVGEVMLATAAVVDAAGSAFPTPITWSTSNSAVITVTDQGVVTGVATGSAALQAAGGGMSTGLNISVSSPVTMSLNLQTIEKLPNGTQQLFVVDQVHNPGPYIWSVNNIDNGNATYGTIVPGEGGVVTYVAPAAVPVPATFDVCARRQADPTARGCVTVTIKPVPSGGADVIVVNDVNIFDSNSARNPSNVTFYLNLANYTASGPRANQKGVLIFGGHYAVDGGYYVYSGAGAVLSANGYNVTVQNNGSATLAAGINPNVKVIFLELPSVPFSNAEINVLKQFAADGGRIVYVGEHQGYYGNNIFNVENPFFHAMGAQLTNTGGALDCGYNVLPASVLRPHQITTGMTNVEMACSSTISLGPNDYALMYNSDMIHVFAAVAKIDVTPLPSSELAGPKLEALMRRPGTMTGRTSNDPAGRDLVRPAPKTPRPN